MVAALGNHPPHARALFAGLPSTYDRIGALLSFGQERLQALARLSIGAHGAVYNVSFLFFGIGSPVFCYLWLKSRYVPRALAAFGVFASLLVGTCALAFIVFPEVANVDVTAIAPNSVVSSPG